MANPLTTAPANSQDLNSAQSSQAVQTLRGAQAPGTDSKKIDKAARSFESLLVGHWLEQAEKSFASVPGTNQDEQNDSSRDQFLSIACESLAQGLSKTGGFGIAAMISKRLEAAAETAQQRDPQPVDTPAAVAGSDNSSSIK
jgi:Rod binding domain-containing protein